MPRSTQRTWVKLYCYQRLHGSVVYQLTEAEQSVWDKILCFAGLCGGNGVIADNDGRPLPHHHIAHEIHSSLEDLESTIEKCIKEGRIYEDGSGLHITNWLAYQSEYQRQKPYRENPGEYTAEKSRHEQDTTAKGKYGQMVRSRLDNEVK